jgi:hypothetical protein
MRERIKNLDATTAKGVLDTIAKTMEGRGYVSEWTPDMGHALRDAFGISPDLESVSDAELARQALFVLAEHSDYCHPIRALTEGPTPERFGMEMTIALVPAVLLVLQTHVRFKRDKTGKWEILIEKKPTQTELLKPLVDKLLSWISGGQ